MSENDLLQTTFGTETMASLEHVCVNVCSVSRIYPFSNGNECYVMHGMQYEYV